jgi:hypothetical protein
MEVYYCRLICPASLPNLGQSLRTMLDELQNIQIQLFSEVEGSFEYATIATVGQIPAMWQIYSYHKLMNIPSALFVHYVSL